MVPVTPISHEGVVEGPVASNGTGTGTGNGAGTAYAVDWLSSRHQGECNMWAEW